MSTEKSKGADSGSKKASPNSTFAIPHFHAPFLDGVRGLAVLFVVWEHSDSFRLEIFSVADPENSALESLGGMGVQMFFVLSAFLLTYLSLVEWEAVCLPKNHFETAPEELTEQQKQDQLRLSYHNLTLLDQPTEPPMPSNNEPPFDWVEGRKIWYRYFIRRLFRIWPPYVLLLLILCIIGQPMYREHDRQSDMTIDHVALHAVLYEGWGVFWTIPLECTYYLVIPLIVLFYVGVQQFSRRSFPGASLYFSKVFGFLVVVAFHFAWFYYDDAVEHQHNLAVRQGVKNPPSEPHWEKHCFTMGSLGAILFREWQRSGYLPLTEEEEKKFDEIHSIPPPPSFLHIQLPSRNTVARHFFGLAALVFAVMSLAFLPHWAPLFYHVSQAGSGDLSVAFSGFTYVAMILSMEASRNGFLKQFFESPFLRNCGAWSFSMYLLHTFFIYRIYTPFESCCVSMPDPAKALYAFDYWMLTIVVIVAASWIWHELIEVPSIDAGAFLIKKYFPKPSKSKSVQANASSESNPAPAEPVTVTISNENPASEIKSN